MRSIDLQNFLKLEQVTSLTTESIIREVQKLNSARSLNVFGGGARNQVIMETLRKRLPSLEGKNANIPLLHFIVSVAISSDYREALGFAILGYRDGFNATFTQSF